MTTNQRNHLSNNRAVEIINQVEGIVRAYVAIWGDPEHRDSFDTWFDKARPPEMDLDLLPIAQRYEHGQDGAIHSERVGEIYEAGFDDVGIYYLCRLDKSSPFFKRVILELQHGTPEGPLRTSSGTVSYLAEFHDDGAFKFWPVSEVSLTSMPSESRMPDVELIRAEGLRDATQAQDSNEVGQVPERAEPTGTVEVEEPNNEERPMELIMEILGGLPEGASNLDMFSALIAGGALTIEELEEVVGMLKAPIEEEVTEEEAPAAPPTEEEVALSERSRFVKALEAVVAKRNTDKANADVKSLRHENGKLERELALSNARMSAPPASQAQRGDSTGGGQISGVEDLRYSHLSVQDMAYGAILLCRKNSEGISADYSRALHHKAGEYSEQLKRGQRSMSDPSLASAFRSAVPFRANEIQAVATTGKGLEWASTAWESMIWEVARSERIMAAMEAGGLRVHEVPQGAKALTIPLEGADPTFYSSAENISLNADGQPAPTVEASAAASANTTVTPKKAMARSVISTELLEDSIVPFLPQYTFQINEAAADAIEYCLMVGDTDTTASTNINAIDSTPATGTSAPLYLVTDGVFKYALITGPAAGLTTSRDGGALADSDFVDTRALLPDANSADPAKLLFVSDVRTMLKAIQLTAVKTQDVFAGATIENGVLTGIWGTPYVASAQVALANSAGKIATAAGTLGRLACIYPAYWALVWKRQITVKVAEDINTDTTTVVASMRFAFEARGAGASTASYNITV